MKKNILVALFLMVGILISSNESIANEDETLKTPEQLQKIIITPNRFSQKFKNSTGEITIITREDIENSGTEVLLNVFRTIKGVLVTDWYGNGVKATVDLRGFGETSSSNALVLVDGRRANTPDLSGVDWTQIPLERVERIEILHGGTGSVLYGDNAVGGVINIITKSGKTEKPTYEFYASGGSYNMNKQSISCDGSTQKTSYSLTVSRFDTNGFRENSEYRGNDFGAKLKYQLNDAIAFKVSGGYHDADFGLPGPLNDQLYNNGTSKRDSTSTYENDNVGEEDYYLKLGLEGLTFDIGILNIDFSMRTRKSSNYFSSWNQISHSKINTYGFTPNYTCTLDLFGRPNKIIAGIDFYKTDNMINDFSYSAYNQTNDNDIDKDSLGLYVSDSFDITDKLAIDFGFRHERISQTLDFIGLTAPANTVSSKQKRKEEAFKGGMVYSLNPETQLFFNTSKSFRSPLTEEFLYYVLVTPPWGYERRINARLSAQTSLGFDLGVRHAFNKYVRLDLTFFNMDVDNEIFYNPSTDLNDNYEKTRHQGLDMQVDFKLTKRISAFANWMYTRARFIIGTFDGKTIPMVPLNKASAGLNLGFWENFKVVPIINFVGRKYMISDQANQAGKLDSYITADIRMSYEADNYKIFFNLNNIFDRRYVEYAVTNSAGTAKNYYPSPGRNFSAGAKFKF